MAYTKIKFENPRTGHIKEAPVGYAWTVLFFGWFPPLFRSDWKWGIIIFLLEIVTSGLAGLVLLFIYNKIYIKELISKGFKAKSVENGGLDDVALKLGMTIPTV